ncbi:MAG: molybdopterin converting factor subunit 1 [Sphingomonadales bacterium]|nr:molybdopterin converting factor subunit 1 [Sphingomonadales bacterium]
MQILYFSRVREAIGKDEETLTPPADVTTVDGLLNWLSTKDEGYEQAFKNRDGLRAAVNQTFSPMDAPIKHGDEIAIFPPVTGG